MTPQELDSRIDSIHWDDLWDVPDDDIPSVRNKAIKQLLYDVIQAITPEKMGKSDSGDRYNQGRNDTINLVEENIKNLLGE